MSLLNISAPAASQAVPQAALAVATRAAAPAVSQEAAPLSMHEMRNVPHLKKLFAAGACAAAALVVGCAGPSSSGSVYTPGQAQREQTVRMGVVESVRQVTIEKTPAGAGAVAGGVVGGVAGSSVGGGKGSTITSVLGAVAGGLAGQAIEGAIGRKAGVEVTVKLDNGELRAITQEADEVFKPGERVRLLSGTGVTRVSH